MRVVGPAFELNVHPRVRTAGLVAAAVLTSAGCAALAGDQDTEMKFLVRPMGSGAFEGWTEVKLHEDTSQIDRATLDFITLSRLDNSAGADLTFIHFLTVDAGEGSNRTLVAKKYKMPKGERSVPLDVVYRDDLKRFFPDGQTIHVDWSGAADTTNLPAEGVWIDVHVRVHLE